MNIRSTLASLLLWALPLAIWGQAPSTDGLIAYWKFDETSGVVADDKAGAADATLKTGATFAPTNGQSGGALQINSTTGVAEGPAFSLSGNTMTLSAWVLANNTTSNATRRVLNKYNGPNSSDLVLALNITSQGSFEAKFTTDGSSSNAGSGVNKISMDAWNHIAATYDGAKVRLYLNGALVTTSPATGNLLNSPGAITAIGNRPSTVGNDQPFNGLIDELRVYNRALTASEISSLTTTEAYRQLPVTFTSFQANSARREGVELNWTVADQVDNAGFAIERAEGEGSVFTEVGFVAGHAAGDYRYTDRTAPAGTLYYRLRQLDHDGTESYSSLVTVQVAKDHPLSVFPNPAAELITIRGNGDYVIVDALGRRVNSGMVADQRSISLADLPPGTYTLLLNRQKMRFVKQ